MSSEAPAPTLPAPDDVKRPEPRITVSISLRTLATVGGVLLAYWLLLTFSGILIVFPIAILLAATVDKPAKWLARHHVPRPLGVTIIFLALLWVVGAPVRLFAGILGVLAIATVFMITSEGYRSDRIEGWLRTWENAQGSGYQAAQGQIAMGSGGWFGLGLGSSRQKWDWVPHAESDFIFSILGEELGLMGTLVVVALFGLLGYAGLRIASRVNDPFVRLTSAATVAWIAGQAIVNIGAVIGVLPITGIPLPLVSYGGSALLPTLAALGMLLSFAKREPGAAEALAARGPGPAARALSWLGLRR